MAATAKSPIVPPLAFRFASHPSSHTAAGATSDDSHSVDDYDAAASIPGLTPPPPPDCVAFEREDGPLRHVKVPRHSPLPGARAGGRSGRDLNAHAASVHQVSHTALAAQEDPYFVVDKPRKARPPAQQHIVVDGLADGGANLEGRAVAVAVADANANADADGDLEDGLGGSLREDASPSDSFSGSESSLSTDKPGGSSKGLAFCYGVVLGLLPPLIILHPLFQYYNVAPVQSRGERRLYVYGRSLGLLVLVAAIVVVVIVLRYRR